MFFSRLVVMFLSLELGSEIADYVEILFFGPLLLTLSITPKSSTWVESSTGTKLSDSCSIFKLFTEFHPRQGLFSNLENFQEPVFITTSTKIRGMPHFLTECVPIDLEEAEFAPMYFQKAFQDAEGLWATNKAVINTMKEQSHYKKVPPQLGSFYFHFSDFISL